MRYCFPQCLDLSPRPKDGVGSATSARAAGRKAEDAAACKHTSSYVLGAHLVLHCEGCSDNDTSAGMSDGFFAFATGRLEKVSCRPSEALGTWGLPVECLRTALLVTMVGLSMSYVYELDDDFDGDLNDKASSPTRECLDGGRSEAC